MNYVVNGKKVSLLQSDFVTSGGEAKIFQKGNVAYKVYDDLKKMIPVDKIKELQLLDKPNIIRPKDIIWDQNKNIIGFTMDWLGDNKVALCKLFTNTFRNSNSITNDMIIELVENMKEIIFFIHTKNCLIVDGNELNYLVDKDFTTPYFIDVNSYQTPNYPATAIMPSIRDWATKKFTTLTDWFSFAIISFQLFVGIHPFKGKHEKYDKNDFEKRVIDHISVFNSKVSVPPTTRDFNLIPSSYKVWYYDLFEKGQRREPPSLPGTTVIAPVVVTIIQSTDNFEISLVKEFDSDILYYGEWLGNFIVKTKDKLWINKVDFKVSSDTELVFTNPDINPVLVKIEDNKLQTKSLSASKEVNKIDIDCTEKMIINNMLYLKNEMKLVEISFFSDGEKKIIPVIKTVWNIEPKSSQIFSGIIYQSVLGKSYIVIPIPNHAGKSSCIVRALPELDSYRVIDAKHDNKVCVFTLFKNGIYSRLILIFDQFYEKYRTRLITPIDYSPINFVTLDNGVTIMINDDSSLEMFLNSYEKDKITKIEDPQINSNMRLFKEHTGVFFSQNNKLYKIKKK